MTSTIKWWQNYAQNALIRHKYHLMVTCTFFAVQTASTGIFNTLDFFGDEEKSPTPINGRGGGLDDLVSSYPIQMNELCVYP